MRRANGWRPGRMWAWLGAACLVAFIVSCAPPEVTDASGGDTAADRQAVLDAHQALVEAYQKGDADAFVLMLDKSDDLLIYHPRIEDRWQGIDDVQANLAPMFARLGKATWLDVHLDLEIEGDVGWITSHVVIESPNVDVPFTGRGTEIWIRRADSWRLVHGHWSPNPEF